MPISMDGRGSGVDNVFVERLWRSMKYEEVYLRAHASVSAAIAGVGRYLEFYNGRRPHTALRDQTPDEAYLTQRPLTNQPERDSGYPLATNPRIPTTVGNSLTKRGNLSQLAEATSPWKTWRIVLRSKLGAAAKQRVQERYLGQDRHEIIRQWYSTILSRNARSVKAAAIDGASIT